MREFGLTKQRTMENINDLMPLSHDWNKERLSTLKKLFPDLFTNECNLNIDELKKVIDPQSVNETERYEFRWFGKSAAKRNAYTPSNATLIYDEARSVNPTESENIIIEGENLEALKLLSDSYREQVKCIYIDPPYNTGSDLIYNDDFSQDRKAYWENAGITENGIKIDTNIEIDGRYHSNWLNMMYSRLLIARTLLKDDGAIFISIDDNEVHHLKKLCDEVFGEDNYINTVSIKAKPSAGASGGGEDKRLKKNTEYLMIYVKNRDIEALDLDKAYDEVKLTDHIQYMRDEKKSWKYTRVLKEFGSKELTITVKDGDGNDIKIFTHNGFIMKSISELVEEENISEEDVYKKYFTTVFRDTNAQSSIRGRVMSAIGKEDGLFSIEYIPRSGRNKGQLTTVYYKGTNKDQIAWLKDIAVENGKDITIRAKTGTLWLDFNWNNVSKEGDISFPNGKKPITFIQRMLELSTNAENEDLILDFFGGSGSTGHSVIDLNNKDNGNRKFVLIQIPESTENEPELVKAGYKKISDITIERNRRVVNSIIEEKKKKQPDLFTAEHKEDSIKGLGFKVFKLVKSNFPRVEWAPDVEKSDEDNIASLKKYIADKEAQLVTAFNRNELLTEILLKNGFQLNYKAEKQEQFNKNEILLATDGIKETLICLDVTIDVETVGYFKKHTDKKFICLERALDTTNKYNLKHYLGDLFNAF